VLRRNVQVPLLVVICVAGVLASGVLNQDATISDQSGSGLASLESPNLSILSGRSRLTIRGVSLSEHHERALLQMAAELFDGFDIQTDFSAGIILAKDWESTSSRLLQTVAAMDSAQAVMRDSSISIRGVTSDRKSYAARLQDLRDHLPVDVLVDADVLTSERTTPARDMCERVFARLITEPIAFFQSSAEIRSASLVTLDRLTEFAHDCQHVAIAITGHTDSTGDETWNRQLSLSRAQAVAGHLIDRGVDPARLRVAGRGSQEPVADNSTVRGRELNRRIEFALQ
jgi:OOP family OmpA-OmpF porin